MLLTLVIPARNEALSLPGVLGALHQTLVEAAIPHELLVVNDGSQDDTATVLNRLSASIPTLRAIENQAPHGFGLAVRAGLESALGEVVAIVMADGSDSPNDVIKFYRKIEEGFDCAFGSRFMQGSSLTDYPVHKLYLNRFVNSGIRLLFGFQYNDVTNAFKMYRMNVIHGLKPFLSHHFNLTVEFPLKAIIRGYSYSVTPNSWRNRSDGESKLKLKEMGSRYLFIILYCLIEKWLCAADYASKKPGITKPV